jgi:hypothetical protein
MTSLIATTLETIGRLMIFCFSSKMKKVFFTYLFLHSLIFDFYSQTFFDLSSSNYSQDFSNISSWTNSYAAGLGAENWRVGTSVGTSTVNTATVFVTGTTGGVQRGTNSMIILATGTNSSATDVLMNFTGRVAGTISLDWLKVVNSASATPRSSDLKIQYSIDNGVTFSDLTGYTIPRVFNDNNAESGSLSNITLPAGLDNQSQVVIRFYVWNNGQTGGSGNRPKIQIDNIIITSTALIGCTAPTTQPTTLNFSSIMSTSGQLNWVDAGDGNGQLVVMRAGSAVAATPVSGTAYTANAVFGSGSDLGSSQFVVYRADAGPVNVTNLLPNTTYHVAIFEYNTAGDCYFTSNPLTGSFTTPCNDPTVQATLFTSSSISTTTATVGWTRGDGNQVLVVARAGGAVNADPVDGSNYTANTAFGSGNQIGTGNFVVYKGTGTSVNLTNLAQGTTYHFAIYEFSTPSNCYNEVQLVGNLTTLLISNNSDIIPAGGESATISSLENTPGPLSSVTGVQVWQFTIRDGGGAADADNLPTIVNGLTIDEGTGNAMNDWADAILSADLFDGATHLGTASSITATTIVFTGLTINVADNSNKTISLRISLKCGVGTGNGNLDGDDFQFRILNSNYTLASSGTSGMINFTNCFSVNDQNVFQVVATQLNYFVQPTTTALNNAMSPAVVIHATDACGNLDFNASGNVTITSTGTLSGVSTTVVALNSGVSTFSNLVHNVVGTNHTLNATHTTYGTSTSTFFDIPTSTTFEKGDFAIVAVNTARRASGSADEVCFITFKTISPGTSFEITDNGYERVNVGQWGSTEGTVRFQLKASAQAIPAGSVICIEGPDNAVYGGDGIDYFDIYVCGVKSDANWTATALTSSGLNGLDWNSTDQVFIMQGGNWNHVNGPNHTDTYIGGNILYGWTAIPWKTNLGGTSPTWTTAGSRLPSGMDCYTTNLTGLNDNSKVKYIGPKTGTKFQILSFLNDVSNWQGYSTNALYDAAPAAYNYWQETDCSITGFTVIASPPSGQWTGTVNTDWFYCANWDDFTVPDATVDVTINQTAANNCLVANGTGECNSIVISSNNGSNRNLEVASTGTLNVMTDITINKIAGTGTLVVSTTGTGILNLQNINITGTAASSNNAILRNESASSILNIDGNLNIYTGGLLDLNANGTVNLAGNFNNNHNIGGFDEANSTVILDGTTDQNINTNGFTETFHHITSSKPSGSIILQDNTTLDATGVLTLADDHLVLNSRVLQLNNGSINAIVKTTGTIIDESGASTGNNAGKIVWNIGSTTGAHEFPFAVSVGGNFIPFTFDLVSGNAGLVSVSTYGTASNNLPWPSSPQNVTNLMSQTGLLPDNRMATVDRFWQIDPTGTPTANLTFTYQSSELPQAPYDDPFNIIAQRYNATLNQWVDQIIPGQISSPFSVTVPNISSFSPWTLASFASPLPAELIHFDAVPVNKEVSVTWSTASEINVDYFEVMRSKDGFEFNTIATVDAVGNSTVLNQYSIVDAQPYMGLSYYQLNTIDNDGSSKLSDIKPVYFEGLSATPYLSSTATNWTIYYTSPSKEPVLVEIYDASGKLVQTERMNFSDAYGNIEHSYLSKGMYFIRLVDGEHSFTLKALR